MKKERKRRRISRPYWTTVPMFGSGRPAGCSSSRRLGSINDWAFARIASPTRIASLLPDC
jgi:hypothetical protein